MHSSRRVAEQATLKSATLACWFLGAVGAWKTAMQGDTFSDSLICLKTGAPKATSCPESPPRSFHQAGKVVTGEEARSRHHTPTRLVTD